VHTAPWPTAAELESLIADHSAATAQADELTYRWATEVLFDVRKQRSEAKQPLKVPITKVIVKADRASRERMPAVDADLRAALRVQAFELVDGDPREIIVEGYEAAQP
jgi:valyl-tRNA synthetase